MKHLAAYLLLTLGGMPPSADDIKTVLESVGIDCDEDRLEKLLSELKGKDIQAVSSYLPFFSSMSNEYIIHAVDH